MKRFLKENPLEKINIIMVAAWISKTLIANSSADFAKTPNYQQILTSIKDFIPKVVVVHDYRKDLLDIHSRLDKAFKSLITAEYIKCQWVYVSFLIKLAMEKQSDNAEKSCKILIPEICRKSPVELLDHAIDTLDIAPINTTESILECIQLLLPTVQKLYLYLHCP